MSKKSTQITVLMAGEILGLSERSVLNYIKTKEIEAVKVGKQWHVSKASVEAFQQRHGFIGSAVLNAEETISEDPQESPKQQGQRANYNRSLSCFRCFQLCRQAFQMPKWNLADLSDEVLKERLRTNRSRAIEHLGSGFYSFHSSAKSQHYEYSRSAVGGILALLRAGPNDLVESWGNEISFLEQELLPAYAALIKKIERRK